MNVSSEPHLKPAAQHWKQGEDLHREEREREHGQVVRQA